MTRTATRGSKSNPTAAFSAADCAILLAVKGVGPTVVSRLEQMGIATLADLATRRADDICAEAATILGSICWKNSPQARKAITSVIEAAQANLKPRV